MIIWKFKTYVSPSGRNDVQETIADHDDYGLAAFSRCVEHLAVSPKPQWHEPAAKKLKSEDQLYEIRYKFAKRATRAIGYFAPDGGTFIIVIICYHKDRVYTPADAFKIARSRIKQIENGIASTATLKIFGEDFPADEEECNSP